MVKTSSLSNPEVQKHNFHPLPHILEYLQYLQKYIHFKRKVLGKFVFFHKSKIKRSKPLYCLCDKKGA